jgi:hypothetical protein
MRVIQLEAGEEHADYPVLSMLRDEIAERAGGLSGLQSKFPALVRDAVDFVLDAVETARTQVSELDNVEKTFIGLKLEHLVRDMLDAPKGLRDLTIAGIDVDIKNTVQHNWSIPIETYRNSEPCLLMAVDDASSRCWLGLIIAKPEYLHQGQGNRDTKKGISAAGFANILWIVKDHPFAGSRFAGLDMARFRELRKTIGSGNRRAAQFFRENLRRRVHRDVILALLFDQKDPMKRLRANGGAHDTLSREGIAILIGTYLSDRVVAHQLNLPDLSTDDIVAAAPRTQAEYRLMYDAEVITSQWTS